MFSYRIEAIADGDGMIAVQAFAGTHQEPIATSGAVFHSEEEAEQALLAMMKHSWPAKHPFAVDASIGV